MAYSIPSSPLPTQPAPRPHKPSPTPEFLCWIRKDLIEGKSFSATDCFPATLRAFDPPPKTIKLSREGLGPGSLSFADVVRQSSKMDDRRTGFAGTVSQPKMAVQKSAPGGGASGSKQPTVPSGKEHAPHSDRPDLLAPLLLHLRFNLLRLMR